MTARKKAYLALLANAVLWGVAPPLAKLAFNHTAPFRWLFYRYLFAAPLSLPFIIYYLTKTKLTLRQLFSIIGLELIGTVAVLASLYEGLKLSTAIDTTLISNTAPLFVIIGGIIFLKEKQERHEWLGLTLAVAGTTIIALEPLTRGLNHSASTSLLGNGLILLQNLLWTVYLIIAKKVYRTLPKFLVSAISFWVGLVGFYLLSLTETGQPLLAGLHTPIVFISALYMATFGSIIAATLYMYGQDLIEASEASLFVYLQPLIAIPLAVWWLHDRLTPITLIATLVVALGVYLAEHRRDIITP